MPLSFPFHTPYGPWRSGKTTEDVYVPPIIGRRATDEEYTYLQSLDVEQQMKRYTYLPSLILLMVSVVVEQQLKTYTYLPSLINLTDYVDVEQQVKTCTYLPSLIIPMVSVDEEQQMKT